MKEWQYPSIFRFKEMNNIGYTEINEKNTGEKPGHPVKGKLSRIIPAFQKHYIQKYITDKSMNSVGILESMALHVVENYKKSKHMKHIELLQLGPHILKR